MAKIAFFSIPAQGHINPTLAVLAELIKRGEQVIYLNTEDIRAQVEPTGVTFCAYPVLHDLESQMLAMAAGGKLADNALTLIRIGEALMPFVLQVLEEEKPDLVVYDSLCGWAKQAAEKLRLPTVSSISTFVFGSKTLGAMPPIAMVRMISDMVVRIPSSMSVARQMRQVHGVQPIGLPGALMSTGEFNIVYTSRDFQPNGEAFGDDYQFVGPSITERPDLTAFPFDAITREPVVYISLGTVNNRNMTFYRAALKAFKDHAGQFILSIGKNTDIAALGNIPNNFIVRSFVPQLEVLKKSDVFITHGGMNSVHEGLWYGVPLIVVPQQAEQAAVAGQVVKNGVGIALDTRSAMTVEILQPALDTVLRDINAFRANASRLGDSFRAAGGYQRAADLLIAFGQRAHEVTAKTAPLRR